MLDSLLPDPAYSIYLLLRDPAKLRFDSTRFPRVTVIRGDLEQIERHADLLTKMDLVVHAAASWGGAEAFRVNVAATHRLFDLLAPDRCRKILYFSTASILDAQQRPIAVAGSDGTEYIRSKYQAYAGLPQRRLAGSMLTLFPTLIFGGDEIHPYTFLAAGLPDILRWRWLFRFLTLDGSFQFIHARDIGRIVAHLLKHDVNQPQLVLGNNPLTVGDAVASVCRSYGMPIPRQFDLTRLAGIVAKLAGIKLSAWDRFCMSYRHFVYDAVNAASFGLPTDLMTLEAILAALPNLKH